jgi:hypothetical protein
MGGRGERAVETVERQHVVEPLVHVIALHLDRELLALAPAVIGDDQEELRLHLAVHLLVLVQPGPAQEDVVLLRGDDQGVAKVVRPLVVAFGELELAFGAVDVGDGGVGLGHDPGIEDRVLEALERLPVLALAGPCLALLEQQPSGKFRGRGRGKRYRDEEHGTGYRQSSHSFSNSSRNASTADA